MKKLTFLLGIVFLLGCATSEKKNPELKEKEKIYEQKKEEKAKIVAKFDGIEITEKELEDFLGIAYIMKLQEIYQLKRAALEDLIFVKLQEKKAKEENITLDEYYEKYVMAQSKDPTEEEINDFYEKNKQSFRVSEDEAKKQIRNYLKSQNILKAEEELKGKLFKEVKIERFLIPPKMDLTKGNEPKKGKDGAPIVIVEFTDFQCPFCSRAQSTLEKIFTDYPEKVQLIFKDLPLDFHKQAKDAHIAAHCANEQGKFWEYHDILFKNQSQLFPDKLKEYANQIGLDVQKFNDCFDGRKYEKYVNESISQAQNLGITGTPTFFVNGRMVRGAQPYDVFKQIIEEELQFATQSSGN